MKTIVQLGWDKDLYPGLDVKKIEISPMDLLYVFVKFFIDLRKEITRVDSLT